MCVKRIHEDGMTGKCGNKPEEKYSDQFLLDVEIVLLDVSQLVYTDYQEEVLNEAEKEEDCDRNVCV